MDRVALWMGWERTERGDWKHFERQEFNFLTLSMCSIARVTGVSWVPY